MKYLNHDFSLKERILVCIISILLFAVVYLYFIRMPLNAAIRNASSQKANIELELTAASSKLTRYQRMEEELENASASYMPSYNASKKEVTFLDTIFKNTIQYGIKNTGVTREGNLIRRSFYFDFVVNSKEEVQGILKQLIRSDYRNLVQDISTSLTNKGYVVTGNVIFYETLADGIPDAALPPDSLTSTDEVESIDLDL